PDADAAGRLPDAPAPDILSLPMASHQERSTLVPGASVGVGVSGGIEAESGGVRARGYWEQAWRRLRRDRIAVLSGVMIIVIVLVAFVGAPVATHILADGQDGSDPYALTTYHPALPR